MLNALIQPPAAAALAPALSATTRAAVDINRWRAIAVGAFLVALGAFGLAGAAWVRWPILALLAGWLGLTGAWHVWLTRQRSTTVEEWQSAVISMVDLTLVTVALGVADGAWWFGPTMHLVVIAACALSLRFWSVIAVTAYGALCYAALIASEAAGLWARLVERTPVPMVGRWAYAVEIILLAWLAMFLTVLLLWGFHERLHGIYRRFRLLFDASPYFIFTVRPDGGLTSANPVARRYGLPATGVASPSVVLDRIPPGDREQVRSYIAAAFAGTPGQFEHRIVRDDGVERWLRVTYTPTGTADQQRVLVMGADITDERTAAAERDRLSREVETAGRMRLVGQLVSGVAHELNNPLAAILNYGELLRAEARPAQDAEALDVIHTQAMRARAIVRDLLHIARASGDRVREVASIDEVVRRALQPMAARAAERGTHLQLEVAGEVHPQRMDVPGIEQVITNLVANAIDAAPGGVVRVLVEPLADGTRVEVADSGAGIPPDVRPHIFEPFFTTKPPGHGTGLGLAVSRGIVEQHGGTLRARNGAPGSGIGARFVVTLPGALADRDEATTGAPGSAMDHASISSNERMQAVRAESIRVALLIDDEAVVRAPMARALRNAGWAVIECGDGEAALAMLQRPDVRRVDVIVSDIRMPRMDGPAFYRRLLTERPALTNRLLFATGDTASDEVAHFLADTNCPVIEKPFALRELIAAVEKVAASPSRATSTR